MSNYNTKFVQRSTIKHKNKYDYSKIPNSFSYKDLVTIICPIHGDFSQRARTHVAGSGCQSCAKDNRESNLYNNKRHTKEQFVAKAIKTHGNKYNYSKTEYSGQMKMVTITCPAHGDFAQLANNHIHGNGCARCSDSKGERMIQLILDEHNVEYVVQKTFPDCKNYSRDKPNVLPFDVFIPTLNMLIEYDGKHHFEPVPFNGVSKIKAKELHQRTIENDQVKDNYASNKGYMLVRISYKDDILTIINQLINNGKFL